MVVRRRQLRKLAQAGTRAGWAFIALATAAFFTGVVAGFNQGIASIVTAALMLATIVMVPAIILGYGVTKAEREDPGPETDEDRAAES